MKGRIGSPRIRIAATALIENPNLTLQQSLAVASYSKKQAADLQRQKTVSKRKCHIMKAANEQNNKHAKLQSENKENINIIINSSSSDGTGVSSMTSSGKKNLRNQQQQNPFLLCMTSHLHPNLNVHQIKLWQLMKSAMK
jgi:hypothetical protein